MSNNKILSKKFVLQIVTMLSVMILAASAMPSLAPAKVFAQAHISDTSRSSVEEVNVDSETEKETASYSEGRDNGVYIDPMIMTSVQPDINVHIDLDIIMDEEDCEEASDNINQENVQSSEQEGRSNGEIGDNSVYVSPKVETAVQSGVNVAVTPDVVLTDKCNPSDHITQGNVQTTNQQVGGSDDEDDNLTVGEGTRRFDPVYATSKQDSRNIAIDRNYYRD